MMRAGAVYRNYGAGASHWMKGMIGIFISVIAGEYSTLLEYLCDEIYLNSEQGKVEFLRNYLFFPDDGLVFNGFWRFCLGSDSVSAEATGEASPWIVLNCLTSLVVETKRVTDTKHILSGTQIASL